MKIPASMLTTDSNIFSTDCTGLHLSELDSQPIGSSPGACNIEMQTLPSGYTNTKYYYHHSYCNHYYYHYNFIQVMISNYLLGL